MPSRLTTSAATSGNGRRPNVKDSSINRELAFLRAVFNELIEDEKWDGRNPVLSKFSKSEKKNRRIRYLLGEEEQRLMEALPTFRDRAIVGLAINLGFRRSNVFELTWDKVDFEAGLAWATDTKSGDDYSVPLSAEALAILRALPRTSRWVFPSETARAHWILQLVRAGFRARLRARCRAQPSLP